MAFTIDPAKELLHALSKRLTATIVGLPTSKLLSPGRKVRVGKAFDKIHRALVKAACEEIGLTARRPSRVDAGVRFTLVEEYEEWVIDEAACARLFPRSQHPEAWRKSKKGGKVTVEVGPMSDE